MDKGYLTVMTNQFKDRPISEIHLSFWKKMRDNEFCDVTLASVDGQKFKAHKFILSASSIFFKKLLVNNFNNHPLIFMRKIENENHLLH